ncbi:hypothetical protein AHMF7605_24945 [Adhaeribacter arboris]|uniref:Uncharacterized protein n=1 Tax=Adhaeribacter arboris TaxID=2072846 RepID=A0A2T2YLX5_9BACT|nr:hypothetical protein [Adhaeribacter arboris]PSR56510.1 hypothetical protein AHMF7605_24945 [Adhaeribacter arboris]
MRKKYLLGMGATLLILGAFVIGYFVLPLYQDESEQIATQYAKDARFRQVSQTPFFLQRILMHVI